MSSFVFLPAMSGLKARFWDCLSACGFAGFMDEMDETNGTIYQGIMKGRAICV